jgi:hypothetical protein
MEPFPSFGILSLSPFSIPGEYGAGIRDKGIHIER